MVSFSVTCAKKSFRMADHLSVRVGRMRMEVQHVLFYQADGSHRIILFYCFRNSATVCRFSHAFTDRF